MQEKISTHEERKKLFTKMLPRNSEILYRGLLKAPCEGEKVNTRTNTSNNGCQCRDCVSVSLHFSFSLPFQFSSHLPSRSHQSSSSSILLFVLLQLSCDSKSAAQNVENDLQYLRLHPQWQPHTKSFFNFSTPKPPSLNPFLTTNTRYKFYTKNSDKQRSTEQKQKKRLHLSLHKVPRLLKSISQTNGIFFLHRLL